jgi:hypothetical protein
MTYVFYFVLGSFVTAFEGTFGSEYDLKIGIQVLLSKK